MNAQTLSLLMIASCASALLGCQGCSEPGHSDGTDETETPSQTQTETTDTQSATQSGTSTVETDGTGSGSTVTESHTQTDTPSSTVSTDTGTGSNTDTGTETETGGAALPSGCEIVARSAAITWDGANAIDGSRMVWSEYNYDKEVPELRARDLSTGKVEVVVSDANWEDRNAIWGNRIFFDEELVPGDWTTREVFFVDVEGKTKQRLSNDSCSDAAAIPGSNFVVHRKSCDDEGPIALYYTNLTTLESREIVPDAIAPPGGAGMAFDGERYVAWSWRDVDVVDDHLKIYLFDILNPGKPVAISPVGYGQDTPVIANGKVFSATGSSSTMDEKRLEIAAYDFQSKTTTWIVERPYDQLPGDASGYVLAYQNTEETGKGIFDNGGRSRVELKDLETGTVRKVTQVIDKYSQLGMSGQYLAFIVLLGGNAGSLVACDLKAGGFMGEDGHLISGK